MTHFLWQFALGCEHDEQMLRHYINKYGIYAIDISNKSIFHIIVSIRDKRIIDVLFKFKPDLLTLSLGHIQSFDALKCCDYYVLEKFLEQDTSYRYVRKDSFKILYPLQGYKIYDSFVDFLPVYMENPHVYQEYDQRFISMLKDHYYKSLTFFELMFRQLFK